MHILVNGVRLFFDVEGAKLVADGPAMREKPTLLLLHGGPGFDHSIYKPAYSPLADAAQLVYLDHRGNGRSDDGPKDKWTLAQWGDDVRTFCEALGIVRPIVLGASFGGMVALAYATRHPEHPGKLVLISTEAKGDTHLERRIALFERFGGPEAGELARRRFRDPAAQRDADSWARLALPHYSRTPRNPDIGGRTVAKPAVAEHWWAKPDGESHRFDMLADLKRIQCPTLVLGGEDDPMHPIESQADIAAALPAHLVQFERFANCGHGVVPDAPERAMKVIREFILRS